MLKLKQKVEEESTVLKRSRSCKELDDVEEMFLAFSTLLLLTKGSARDDARAGSRQQQKARDEAARELLKLCVRTPRTMRTISCTTCTLSVHVVCVCVSACA